MERAEALENAEATLNRAGYEVSRRCSARTSCFDFAARKEKHLVFVKVFPDIRDVSRGDAWGIKAISRCFTSVSLFISDMSDATVLKDDTVYSRYGIYVVTSKTLDDIVRGSLPLVEASPGGYCVRMVGSKIRERRHELGLSIGKLAEMAGISRRTLYGYERNMTRASVSAAYRLEEVLGVPLAKTIDIFDTFPGSPNLDSSSSSDQEKIRSHVLRFILGKLTKFDMKVSLTHRAPFDFTANCSHEAIKILGGVLQKKEKAAEARIEEILSLSRIVKAKPLLIGRKKINTRDDIVFIDYNDLAKMNYREEITALF